MRVFTKAATYAIAKDFLTDLLLGIKTVDIEFANLIINSCDLVFQEQFEPIPFIYQKKAPSCISICPREISAYFAIQNRWHDVIGKLLPVQRKRLDYPAWINAMKIANFTDDQIQDAVTGISNLKALFDKAQHGDPIVAPANIPETEFEVVEEYKRSLFDYNEELYSTFDLWHPESFNSFQDKDLREWRIWRIWNVYYKKRGLRLYEVFLAQKIEHCQFYLRSSFSGVTKQQYQQFYIELKSWEFQEKKENEERQEFESKIDYSLVPSDEQVLSGQWTPSSSDIICSHRVSDYLRSPSEYHLDKLNKDDYGKPPLWHPIWLFFRNQNEPSDIGALGHDLLNEIVGRRFGDKGASWLHECAERWLPFTQDKDDTYEYDKEYIQERNDRASQFAKTLQNLCANDLVVVKEPDFETYGIINIEVTSQGIETVLLEAQRYDAERQEKDYCLRAPLTSLIANFNEIKDYYIRRGVVWKWFHGVGWFIDSECQERAQDLNLDQYVENFPSEQKLEMEKKQQEWNLLSDKERFAQCFEELRTDD